MRLRVLIDRGVNGISLQGRSVIVAMCVGQLGSLLPHVVVPSILAAFLIPEWKLSGAQAGLLAGSGAAGYMLTVPVLATLTDRIDARRILIAGSALSALGTSRERPSLMILDLMMPGIGGHEVLERLKDDPQTASIPVVMITSRFINEDERHQILGRASRVIYKGDLSRELVTSVIDEAVKG